MIFASFLDLVEDLGSLGSHPGSHPIPPLRPGAQDDLIALQRDHGLHGDSLEALGRGEPRDALLHVVVGLLHRIAGVEVQHHATHIGLGLLWRGWGCKFLGL